MTASTPNKNDSMSRLQNLEPKYSTTQKGKLFNRQLKKNWSIICMVQTAPNSIKHHRTGRWKYNAKFTTLTNLDPLSTSHW